MSACPVWLVAGARVSVRAQGSRESRDYDAVVVAVEWPFLVYFEGLRGAAHPSRVRLRDVQG